MPTTWLRVVMAALVLTLAGAADAADGPQLAPATRTVREFGAVGDGQADDTVAFQKAVDAGVGDLWLPRGRYRLTRPVVIDLDRVGPTSVQGTGAATVVMA